MLIIPVAAVDPLPSNTRPTLARFWLHMPEVDLKSEAPGRVPVRPAVIMVGTLVVIMPHPTTIRPAQPPVHHMEGRLLESTSVRLE